MEPPHPWMGWLPPSALGGSISSAPMALHVRASGSLETRFTIKAIRSFLLILDHLPFRDDSPLLDLNDFIREKVQDVVLMRSQND